MTLEATHIITILTTFASGPVLTHKVIVLVRLPVIDDFEPIAMPGMSMNSVDNGPKMLIVSIVGVDSTSYERVRMNQLMQHCRPHLPERLLRVFAEDNEVRLEPHFDSSCVITIWGKSETNVASTRRVCCHLVTVNPLKLDLADERSHKEQAVGIHEHLDNEAWAPIFLRLIDSFGDSTADKQVFI